MPAGLRTAEPAKMTSIISLPRRDLEDRSPSTHLIASTTLDLPQPLGPTMSVMGSENEKVVLSAKLLNPASVNDARRRPAARGKTTGAFWASDANSDGLDRAWVMISATSVSAVKRVWERLHAQTGEYPGSSGVLNDYGMISDIANHGGQYGVFCSESKIIGLLVDRMLASTIGLSHSPSRGIEHHEHPHRSRLLRIARMAQG